MVLFAQPLRFFNRLLNDENAKCLSLFEDFPIMKRGDGDHLH